MVSVPSKRTSKLCTNVHHHDHGAAMTIFANGSYFVDTPYILQVFKKSLRKVFGTKKV
jgi:hypothetical protein